MKIVNIIGGLGNQMFCYAFALALRTKFDEKIKVDISHFNKYNLHNGFLVNEIFKIDDIEIASRGEINKLSRYIPNYKLSRIARKFLPTRTTEFIEPFDYLFCQEVFHKKDNCYYEGYWQSPLYFADIERYIKESFQFPSPQFKNRKLEKEILGVDSVGIHIRRGDYVNAKSFTGICELPYYQRAIAHIKKNIEKPHYYIFSNDITWCKNYIFPLLEKNPACFVTHNEGRESYWDMYLMSCCKSLILANSSFSWWAAYLNKNATPLIISPFKWVNRNYKTDIHLDSWIRI